MSRRSFRRPTDAELAILNVLWDRGPSSVHEVYEQMGGPDRGAYTTILKMLQIMLTKGLVHRDETHRRHVYRARYSKEQTQQLLVRDLIDRAFGGSARKLVMQALAEPAASDEELAQIRRWLAEQDIPPHGGD